MYCVEEAEIAGLGTLGADLPWWMVPPAPPAPIPLKTDWSKVTQTGTDSAVKLIEAIRNKPQKSDWMEQFRLQQMMNDQASSPYLPLIIGGIAVLGIAAYMHSRRK